MDRRQFLQRASLAGGAAFVGVHAARLEGRPARKQAQDVVSLGKTGIRVSRLAQGTGTDGYGHSSNQWTLHPRACCRCSRR
jgi:hypothetical protein